MASIPGIVPLDNTMGALLVGSLLGTALYGITSHQFFRYYRMYPGDPRRLKSLVGVLWALDSLHVLLIMHTCYHYLVTYYFQPQWLLDGVWSLRLVVIVNAVITTITHFFFAHRILQLNGRKWWLPLTLVIIAVIRLGVGLTTTIVTFLAGSFQSFSDHYTWLVCMNMAGACAADFSVAVTLCYYLHSKYSGLLQRSITLDSALVYLINTGLFTSILMLIDLIFVVVMPHNLIYLGLYFVIGKLYTNSLMAVLNARRSALQQSQLGSFDLGWRAGHQVNVVELSPFRPRPPFKPDLTIEITREVEVEVTTA